MEIGLVFNCAPQLFKYQPIIVDIESNLKTCLSNRTYGEDVLETYVGLICSSPEMKPFFKPMKARYNKNRKVEVKDKIRYELFRTFQYEYEISFDKLMLASPVEARVILINEVINSLSSLDKLPKSAKDFNVKLFKEDVISCLKNLV